MLNCRQFHANYPARFSMGTNPAVIPSKINPEPVQNLFLMRKIDRSIKVFTRLPVLTAAALIFVLGSSSLRAQPIAVPNFSFELQSAAGFPQGANPNVDAWQKIAEPAFYGPAFGGFGIPWFGTAGVFVDSNPYGNAVGTQAGYILAVPQVTLFQDYDTSPTHEFDGTFEVGKAYNLTIGVFGKTSIAPGSTLE